jgi:hypothetical protein
MRGDVVRDMPGLTLTLKATFTLDSTEPWWLHRQKRTRLSTSARCCISSAAAAECASAVLTLIELAGAAPAGKGRVTSVLGPRVVRATDH